VGKGAARACRAAALMLAMVGAGRAQEARAWDFGTGIGVAYDDNILSYSERDLFAFRYRLNPPRFALETTDDLVFSQYVEATWEADSSRGTSALARVVADRYSRNTICNDLELLLLARTRVTRRWRLSLAATHLPSHYIRRYVDYDMIVPYPELPRYRDAKYRQTGVAASVERRLVGSWREQLGYEYERRDFLDAFPERDQDRHELRLSVRPPRLGRLAARIRGGYGRALARGRNWNPGDGRPDISTRSLSAGLTFEWAVPLARRITLHQAVDYEDRKYTTRDTLDTQRFGRSIHEWDLDWELVKGLSRQWEIAASYGLVLQRLTGPQTNLQIFTDAASYNRQRVSVRIGWTTRGQRVAEGE
jgi:hypothetical protein